MRSIHSIFIAAISLLLLLSSCSGKNTGDRSEGSDPQSGASSNHIHGGSDSRPSDNGEGIPGYNEARVPQPINGTNLVEVLVFANCVIQPESACSQVRLSAKVKVNSADPVRFAADTTSGLGVKSSSWDIAPLDGVTCQTTGGGFEFSPLCTVSSGSLAKVKIRATLNLVAKDGSAFKGDSQDSFPSTGSVYGNFMLLDASVGLTPSKLPDGSGASAEFSQIWAVLKGGEGYLDDLKHVSYVTNILYDGGYNPTGTNWGKSKSLCASVDSGDGAGKWHLPEIWELCGSNYESATSPDSCNGGAYKHGIKNVTFAGGSWSSINYFWSSSPASSGLAWYADLNLDLANTIGGLTTNYGVFCVR